jgi:hypothetical protein
MTTRRDSLQDAQCAVLLVQEDAGFALCPFGFFFFGEFARRRALT